MSIRSTKFPVEKTQNYAIIEFMTIDLDKVKSYVNYLPHNNIDKVLKAVNDSLMMQRIYRKKKNLY